MQERELPKNMGKKIVDALKQQDFEEDSELAKDSLGDFDTSDEISLDDLEETPEESSFDQENR